MRWYRLTVAVLVISGCAGEVAVTPSNSPTQTPIDSANPSPTSAPSASASPSASPSRVPSASPTATLTLPPPTTPTIAPTTAPPPTPTPSPTVDPFGWTELTGFPTYGRRTEITGIAYGEGRFVAVGSSMRNGRPYGRIWTSADGRTWTARSNSAFTGRSFQAVAYDGDDFYAFGGGVWLSADGRSWEEIRGDHVDGDLRPYSNFDSGYVLEAAAAGGYTYFAGGTALIDFTDTECDCASVWRNASDPNGWGELRVSQATVAGLADFEDIAVMGGPETLVVGIGSDPYFGQGVRYTTDFHTWNTPDIALEGAGYLDAASDGQRIVAVGYTGDQFEDAIAVVTDGSTWTTSVIERAAGPAEQLTFAGDRFVAIGAQRRTPGRSWWSTDGLSWVRGPAVPFPPPDPVPPEAGDDPFAHRTIGGGAPGVVLAQTYDGGLHVWFAPVTAFN